MRKKNNGVGMCKKKNIIIKISLLLLFITLSGSLFSQEKTVPLKQKGIGCYSIDVVIDGEEADFLFDTGCSGLLLSKEFVAKIKNKKKLGIKTKSLIAGGKEEEGEIYLIKELHIGTDCFYNVLAEVPVKNEKRSHDMLLGWSVIGQFRSFGIENGILSYVLKDSLSLHYEYVEHYASLKFSVAKSSKDYNEIVKYLMQYYNDKGFTDESMYILGRCLLKLERYKEALPCFTSLYSRKYKYVDVVFHCFYSSMLLMEKHDANKYANKLIVTLLKENKLTENDLLKTKIAIPYLSFVYEWKAYVAEVDGDKELQKKYLKISKNLDYQSHSNKAKR